MKKIVLVDGNNLLYRSFYATSYTGNLMRNSKGFPTNALYGFTLMINKIITEENPEYMMVAFDIGKNFRLQKYKDYKAGRQKTPDELHEQIPYSRKILSLMGIKYFELEPYEADDIIGTFSKMVEESSDFTGTIVSSDKDLLQLIGPKVDIKLLKQKDYIRYNEESFFADYKIKPIRIIDMKAIAGDSSDNIPGVKGIGDKGALSLLEKYDSLEEIYKHLDEITGKTKEKLELSKDDAFLSKDLATIYKEVPIKETLEDCKLDYQETEELYDLYQELEFFSFIKKLKTTVKVNTEVQVKEIPESIDNVCSYYIECDNENYHIANIIGASVTDKDGTYYFSKDEIPKMIELINGKTIYTYDEKKNICLLNKLGLKLDGVKFDTMLALYLLEYKISEDIGTILNIKGYHVNDYKEIIKGKVSEKDLINDISVKSSYIFNSYDEIVKELRLKDMEVLYQNIEHPLINVLAQMEIDGVYVDKDKLAEMSMETGEKLAIIEKNIYDIAGMEFNIGSPRQLANVLYNVLKLPDLKKGSTEVKVLQKLYDYSPIISLIMEYRNLSKLKSTYLDGLVNYIYDDGKIHTIFKQGLTRTGRLSSVSPNLQNIPIRDDEGRKIRKAFTAKDGYDIVSIDYSQIELRILAHISSDKELIKAYQDGLDIHTKVASDIYGVPIPNVTKKMRSTAKAIIFGIVYGISGFGLGENTGLSPKEAKAFIEKYYNLYPGVKEYMDNIVKEAYETLEVRTLFKRKRTIEELTNTNFMVRSGGERIALNTPIQGTSADIIKMAMIKVFNTLKEKEYDAKLLVSVHDELILEVKEEQTEEVIELVKDIMENIYQFKVPLVASASFGKNWYEAK